VFYCPLHAWTLAPADQGGQDKRGSVSCGPEGSGHKQAATSSKRSTRPRSSWFRGTNLRKGRNRRQPPRETTCRPLRRGDSNDSSVPTIFAWVRPSRAVVPDLSVTSGIQSKYHNKSSIATPRSCCHGRAARCCLSLDEIRRLPRPPRWVDRRTCSRAARAARRARLWLVDA
jgi:hypothetical protein